MKLYHYTTLETLALILKYRTIRFNRIGNKLDDLEEGQTHPTGVNIGQYFFISCWTKDPKENIPLWRMYTGSEGVRIGLDKNMFNSYKYSGDINVAGETIKIEGCVNYPIPIEKMITNDYFIVPNFNDGVFFRDITYVDDVNEVTKDAIISENTYIKGIESSKFATYKHKRWEFENECRFVLQVYPRNPTISLSNPLYAYWLSSGLKQGLPNKIDYIDLELSQEAINKMEIRLCPNMSESNKILSRSLCKEYAQNAIIEESELSGRIAFKQ